MHADTKQTKPRDISGRHPLRILNVFKDAIGSKKGAVCHHHDLPHEKELIRQALLGLVQNAEDISAKSELSMIYLSLAEFQDLDSVETPKDHAETIARESQRLMEDLRRLERGA